MLYREETVGGVRKKGRDKETVVPLVTTREEEEGRDEWAQGSGVTRNRLTEVWRQRSEKRLWLGPVRRSGRKVGGGAVGEGGVKGRGSEDKVRKELELGPKSL